MPPQQVSSRIRPVAGCRKVQKFTTNSSYSTWDDGTLQAADCVISLLIDLTLADLRRIPFAKTQRPISLPHDVDRGEQNHRSSDFRCELPILLVLWGYSWGYFIRHSIIKDDKTIGYMSIEVASSATKNFRLFYKRPSGPLSLHSATMKVPRRMTQNGKGHNQAKKQRCHRYE